MRAVVFRSVVAVAGLALVGTVAGLAACASAEHPDAAAPQDGGGDALLLGDTTAPDAGTDVPLGDVCGDGQGLEKDAPWPMRGGCPKRAGVSTSTGPQNATLKWSVELPAGATSPAIGVDRLVWVGTADHDVVVLSPDGTVQNALRTGGAVASSPARSAAGLTVIGSSDGSLYGVDRFGSPDGGAGDAGDDGGDGGDASVDDGGSGFRPARAVWRLPLGPIASSPAIGGDGTIFVTTAAGKLVAVAADGSVAKWQVTTNDTLGSSPALALDGTVYVGSSDGKLYAFTRDGTAKWALDTGGMALGSPVIGGDDTVYVGSAAGKLHAVGPDGKVRWTYAAGGAITGAPCVRGGVVYIGSADKKLHAVSTQTGSLVWAYATLGAVATPVVGADATVYVGSLDGNLYALTPKGLLYFAVNAKGSIRSAPALDSDGTLYVTTDKAIVAIGP
jgi:outer membrane protein assembly factor BamB